MPHTKVTTSYQIADLDANGEIVDIGWTFEGKGARQKAMAKAKTLKPDDKAIAYILERVINRFSVIGDGYYDELEDRDYELVCSWGDAKAITLWQATV